MTEVAILSPEIDCLIFKIQEKKTTVSPKVCLNFHYVCNFMEPTLLDGAHE